VSRRVIRNTGTGAGPANFYPTTPQFSGQCERILLLLLRRKGQWIPTSEFAAIAQQHNSRIFSLRRAGYTIENKIETINGKRVGFYRLIATPDEFLNPQPMLPLEARI